MCQNIPYQCIYIFDFELVTEKKSQIFLWHFSLVFQISVLHKVFGVTDLDMLIKFPPPVCKVESIKN